jgi:hypothetical protein
VVNHANERNQILVLVIHSCRVLLAWKVRNVERRPQTAQAIFAISRQRASAQNAASALTCGPARTP